VAAAAVGLAASAAAVALPAEVALVVLVAAVGAAASVVDSGANTDVRRRGVSQRSLSLVLSTVYDRRARSDAAAIRSVEMTGSKDADS
jgi:hypothetical protein